MTGHRQVVEFRREGMKPAAIFIEAGFPIIPHRYDFENPERALDYGFYPTVTIADLTQRHDMRFCTGCRVHVIGKTWNDELMSFIEKLAEVNPAHIIVSCDTNEILEWKGEWVCKS